MSTDDLIAAVSARIDAFGRGDSGGVLDDQALTDATELWHHASTEGVEVPFAVAQVLAWLHWCRYLALPEGRNQHDLHAALNLFNLIAQVDRRAVPDQILAHLERMNGAVDDGADPGEQAELAVELLQRVEDGNDSAALDRAIRLLTAAVAAAPKPVRRWWSRAPRGTSHLEMAWRLSNLGSALQIRFERTGDLRDLDQAVQVCRRAAVTIPTGHPDLAACLSNLSIALQTRFERTGDADDLDQSVRIGQQTVAITPTGDPDQARYLSNLGIALRTRFERTGDLEDLDQAVQVGRRAVAATPIDHPNLATCLSNLGIALRTRFGRTGDVEDLDQAVQVVQQAVTVTPTGHPDQARYLSNLGNALQNRFERTGNLEDLNQAVQVVQQAVAATPTDHPDQPRYLANLGSAFRKRFERTGDLEDLDQAVQLWSKSAESAVASADVRLRSAHAGANLIAQTRTPGAALPMYRTAIDLLPSLAWRGVSSGDRRYLLQREAAFLGRDAAAAAIDAGHLGLAVELLEQGRGVVWSQLLDTRTDLSALHHAYPDLAVALDKCRTVLDQPTPLTTITSDAAGVATRAGDARRSAARTFDALVARIRELPPTADFTNPPGFLRPPTLTNLLPKGTDESIIVVNISQWRCDALIVTHRGVSLMTLSDLTAATVTEAANRYLVALKTYEHSRRNRAALLLLEMAVTATLEWLWNHITEPILKHLGHTTIPGQGQQWLRVWWCPTGPLTVLPLHAAGRHSSCTGDAVIDRVVSSYTPTLRALTHARTRPKAITAPNMLVVALPNTPDQTALLGAAEEQRLLSQLFPADHRTVLIDMAATHDTVTHHLAHHQWVHASCHGTQDLADPITGGLLPYDWQTRGLISITDLTHPGHAGGEFVFLSACKTAVGGVTHLEEAITIAAAMHYGGWRHVIGTLWTVWDNSALTITDGVYQRLVDHGVLHPTGAARALHQSTRHLRNQYPRQPSTWAPFIHTGP